MNCHRETAVNQPLSHEWQGTGAQLITESQGGQGGSLTSNMNKMGFFMPYL